MQVALVVLTAARPADAQPVSETAPTQTVHADGVRYAYRSFGPDAAAGSIPLVLLQRFRGTMDDWDPAFLDGLARTRRVVVFDNAGVGASSGAVAPTMPGMARQAAAFARAAGTEQADWLGWSMGGMVAQALAVRDPALVRRLVLVAANPPGSPETAVPPDTVSAVAGKLALSRADDLFLLFPHSDAGRDAGTVSLSRTARASARRHGSPPPPVAAAAVQAQGAAHQHWYGGADGLFERLGGIGQPVLVVGGDSDLTVPVANLVLLSRALPRAQLAVYPAAGHAPHHQHPEAVANQVAGFLGAPDR